MNVGRDLFNYIESIFEPPSSSEEALVKVIYSIALDDH